MSKFSLNTLGKLLADKSGLSQVEAELFIRKMFDVCNQGLDADKQVKIKWLGTFKVQATKDRESINVNTGERRHLPPPFQIGRMACSRFLSGCCQA